MRAKVVFLVLALLHCPPPTQRPMRQLASPAARFGDWPCLRATTAQDGRVALRLDGADGRLYFDLEDDAVSFLEASRLTCPGG